MLIQNIEKILYLTQPPATGRRQQQHFDDYLEPSTVKIKILVLEPDHLYRETLCRFARRRGATAIGCSTFTQLKNIWKDNPPDVVILSFVIDQEKKAVDIVRLLGNVPVLLTKHPKVVVHSNFVWPPQLKKICKRTDGAGAIIDDALAFAAEFRAKQLSPMHQNGGLQVS